MSLGVALGNAVSGLRLNQQALSVLSNNMANVNTEGYSRKVLDQSAIYIEGMGNGVRIDDIVRKVDSYLQRSTLTQGSATQAAKVVSNYYDRLQVLLGAPGAQNSLDEYVTTFFTSMQRMADQPERTSYRSNAINAASVLAGQVSTLAYEMESLRFQADSDISGSLVEINSALKKLHELNSAIARAHGMGQSTAGLLDERDRALKTVADNMDITTYFEPNGTVRLTAGSGVPLVDGMLYQLRYTPVASVDNLVSDMRIAPIEVVGIDINGNVSGVPQTLVSGGKIGQIESKLGSGKLQGLVELRDKLIPDILNQLDMLASRLRDSVNGLHNNGSGWPPAQSLTGTRAVYPTQQSEWSGSVRIAVLTADGKPVPANYADEGYSGIRPLTLDFSQVRSGAQAGKASVQTLIDEINAHFGAPTQKVSVGDMNQIRLVSNTEKLPSGAQQLFNFDLELENLSAGNASLFVTNVVVRDASNAVVPNALTRDVPNISVDTTSSYITHAGESYVDINLASAQNLKAGDRIYLGGPGIADVNGIGAAQMTGYFTIESVNGNSIRINTGAVAHTSGAVDDGTGAYAKAAYATVEGGEKTRSFGAGEMQVDFTGSIGSTFYDITVEVGVVNADGSISHSQVTYRVQNNRENLYNQRYAPTAATGDGHIETPLTTQPAMRAILVDENGNELPKLNGKYIENRSGYLKIVGGAQDYVVAIDEMDSQQNGDVTALPSVPGTGWGFSHFFGLNNFFSPNSPIDSGNTLKNSAINLKVEQRLIDNPNLVSSGKLTRQTQPADSTARPIYSYVRQAGDNSISPV